MTHYSQSRVLSDGRLSALIGLISVVVYVLGYYLIFSQTEGDRYSTYGDSFESEVFQEAYILTFGVLVFNFFGLMTSVKSLSQGNDRGYGLIGFMTNFILFIFFTYHIIAGAILVW